jgi:O-antigen ligase
MKHSDKIDTAIARLLMISFFLPGLAQEIALSIAVLYFLVRSFKSTDKFPKQNLFMAVVLGGSYILYLCCLPTTHDADRGELFQQIAHRSSLLLLPLSMAMIHPKFIKVICDELMYFSFACLLLCAVGNIAFVCYYLQMHHAIALSHPIYRQYLEHVTGIHPTYLAMFLCFSIAVVLIDAKETFRAHPLAKTVVLYLLFLFDFSMLAKAPFIALIIVITHFIITQRKRANAIKPLLLSLLGTIATAVLFVPFFSQRLAEVSQFLRGRNSMIDNSMYERQLIWNVDKKLWQQYWATGIGPGKLRGALNDYYAHYFTEMHLEPRYFDCHSEFLTQWISFGLAGIVVFVAILLLHFIKAIKRGNTLYLYLLLIMTVTFFTETVLARQWGVLFYSTLTSLFFFSNNKQQFTQRTSAANSK